jgi:hypothetical protein
MAEDNEKKNLEETKLTNQKLGELKSAINESAEDAEFARQEAAAAAAEEIGGSEESIQEEKAATKANIDAEAKQTKVLEEIQKNGKQASKDSKGAGKLFGGAIGGAGKALGGAIGGVGLGIGAAGAGIGVALLGAATFAEKVANLDGKKIKDNIVEIMSIPDSVGGNLEMLKDGGALTLALTGLGIGLAAFGIGSGAAAAIAQFTDGSGFAETIKQQVVELLSISDALGGNWSMLKDGGALTLALTGLGIGLAVFGAGSTVAGAAKGIQTLTGTNNFAETIKKQVVTLLSISEELGGAKQLKKEGGAFFLAMAGIGAGLAIFGAGAAVASIGQGLGDGIAKFSDTTFAQGIKDNVLTLLSIAGAPELKQDTQTFLEVMTGVAAGLAVFGVGTAIASIGQGLADGIAKFQDTTFAQGIKDNVLTLLSISDAVGGKVEALKKGGTFFAAMTGIGAGLAAFGVSGGIGAFADGVGKLFGGESPMDKILRLADNVDNLKAIGPAFKNAATGINAFGDDIKDFDAGSKGIKNLESFLDSIAGVGLGNKNKLPALKALSGLGSFSATIDGETGTMVVSKSPSGGAKMAAIQEDNLNQQATNASQPIVVNQAGGGGGGNQNMSVTTVNNTITPDRDLTMSMYGMGAKQLI